MKKRKKKKKKRKLRTKGRERDYWYLQLEIFTNNNSRMEKSEKENLQIFNIQEKKQIPRNLKKKLEIIFKNFKKSYQILKLRNIYKR